MIPRRKPKPPIAAIASTGDALGRGRVENAMMPPAALPQVADPLDRRTSTWVVAARSIRSRDVRPSGSVSGKPSTSTRIPRVVPALERSPAPRDPKPRIVRRRSSPPLRDCANRPGMPERSSSIRPEPWSASSTLRPVIAPGCVQNEVPSRDTLRTTSGSRTTLSGGGLCAPADVTTTRIEARNGVKREHRMREGFQTRMGRNHRRNLYVSNRSSVAMPHDTMRFNHHTGTGALARAGGTRYSHSFLPPAGMMSRNDQTTLRVRGSDSHIGNIRRVA